MEEHEFEWQFSRISKITVPHEERPAAERCAEMIVRALREPVSSRVADYYLAAARWFALATVER